MSALIIEPIDDALEAKLRAQAAQNRRSVEDEARHILAASLRRERPAPDNAADLIASIVDAVGGLELDLPGRHVFREPPRFHDWLEPEA